MQKKEIIKLKDVAKYYYTGETIVKAVDGLDISIQEGTFVAIMGPSGSGKSTSLNLIGNLDTPSKGKIFLDQVDTSYLTESELAQIRGKKIGFIFQQFNLIPNLTAVENIMLPMLFQGIGEVEKRERGMELIKLVELEARVSHYPSQLSGGEQQRVAIARALANDPEVILADEPTGNLDTKTGEMVMKFLDNLNKKGKTIIMITHEPHLAIEHASEIYWIKDGKLEKITKKINKKWRTARSSK
jgi:putative ABC transport system ATP-binding protein